MLNRLSLNKLSLNRIDLNRIGGRDVGVSARPYIDPELLKHVKMCISTWGKSNDDPDRAVLKDLSGNGNDMRLLNFGFTGNSGYGMYGANYMDYTSNEMQLSVHTDTKISGYNQTDEGRMAIKLLVSTLDNIPSYKIKVTNLVHTIRYYYIDPENPSVRTSFPIKTNGVYELPASRNDIYNGESVVNVGFAFDGNGGGATIEQLPDFEGWLCTDGVDDLIESVKPVSEMLEGSNEITVVSIIHQISLDSKNNRAFTNYISYYKDSATRTYLRNQISDINKTGIYGYTYNGTTLTGIYDILGDKADYNAIKNSDTDKSVLNGKLSVCGYATPTGYLGELTQIAYAGGFIANKVLTTDEINQIIAYFNLDRPGQIIKPQLYCNIKKQGITNENHAEFNDQLIDFVGGHNIQLNNVAWEGESGINSYPVVLGINKTFRFGTHWEVSNSGAKMSCVDIVDISLYSLYYNVNKPEDGVVTTVIPSFTIKVSGINDGGFGYLRYGYLATPDAVAITEFRMTADGTYTLPKCYGGSEALDRSKSCYVGFSVEKTNVPGSLIIEVLPTIENALCLDGISDFGKATGLPVLKDYTVVADREIETINGGIISKSYSIGNGAFIFELTGSAYSFGNANVQNNIKGRMISYMSKYSYNGNSITPGTGIDGDTMWLATIRDNYINFSKLALWSLMLFPYSLSEFLLERQLRKYKAGTLYPDMIEFRPIVKSNIPYLRILYFITSTGDQIIKGSYIPIGSVIQINIQTVNATDEISSVSVNGKEVDMYNKDETYWRYRFKVTKSPQKINIVISSYLTTLGNETLISNETLIKNE